MFNCRVISMFIVSYALCSISIAHSSDFTRCEFDHKTGEAITCPPPGGNLILFGKQGALCGPGECTYSKNEVYCSSVPGGSATWTEKTNEFRCVGGCVPGDISYCQPPR